jgi:fumarate reductase subunit C
VPQGAAWFMARPGFRRFMAREATSFAVAAFLVWTLVLLRRLKQGEVAWAEFMELTRHPIVVAAHAIVFGAVVYHAVTWFNLTPKAMPMQFGEERVPDFWVSFLTGYLPCAAVSALFLWGVLR